jgi:hypothetical protein
MSIKARKRVIALALILMLGQLTFVVHATVHNAELNCQICLSQAHYSKVIVSSKATVPTIHKQDTDLNRPVVLPAQSQQLRPYLQRAPPVITDH